MNYRIKYSVIVNGNTIPNKEIIVKNKCNELIAKVSLEEYLRRKYGNSFNRLVINSCYENNPLFEFFNL